MTPDTLSSLLTAQLDYLYFFDGLALLYVAGVSLALLGTNQSPIRWRWLAYFGIIHGGAHWLDVVALNIVDHPAFFTFRLAITTLSHLLLIEFGRVSALGPEFARKTSRWFHLLITSAVFATAALGGIPVLYAFHIILGLFGTSIACFALWRRYQATRLGSFAVAAVTIAGYGLTTFPGGLETRLFEGSWLLPLPVVASGLWAFALALALSRLADRALEADLQRYPAIRRRTPSFAVASSTALCVVVVLGWITVEWSAGKERKTFAERLVELSEIATAYIEPVWQASYQSTFSDTNRLRTIESRLKRITNASSQIRRTYVVVKPERELTYLASQPPVKAAQANLSEADKVFDTGHTQIAGPYVAPSLMGSKRQLISAFAALPDPKSGVINAVVGIDVDAGELQRLVGRARSLPIAATMLLATIVLFFSVVLRRLQVAAGRIASSETRFRDIVHSSADMVWETDASYNFTYVSQNAKDTLGFEPAELLGKGAFSLMPDRLRPEFESRFAPALSASEPFNDVELVLERKDGSCLAVLINAVAVLDGNGRQLGYRGTTKNITERKTAEDALKRTNSLYRATIEATRDGIMVVDENRTILEYNSCFLSMWDIDEASFGGQRYDDMLAQYGIIDRAIDPDGFRAHVLSTIDPQAPSSYFIVHLKDGRVLERYSVPQVLDGRRVARVCIYRDITERQRMEREKEEMQKRIFLSQKLASIGELAAGIAHEINNPLAIVKGYIASVHDELKTRDADPQFFKFLEKQDAAVDRIAGIVNGLRTYARSDTEHVENVDIHKVINDTISLVDHIYRKAGISIDLDLKAQAPVVKGNIGKFQQVLMNLISNAKDALETAGRESPIVISTRSTGNRIALSVSDSGCGMDPETRERVFDAFFTTKPPGKGTGLGLAITHSIVQAMNGRIDIESHAGNGTTVTLDLPLSDGQPSAKKKDKPAALEPIRGRALVVDDEHEIRDIISDYLLSFGLEVDTAEDGYVALKKLTEASYDFIITDLRMPRMDGEVLIREIRRLLHDSPPAIIVITGGIITEYSQEQRATIRTLADGYIMKPFAKKELHRILEACREARAKAPPLS